MALNLLSVIKSIYSINHDECFYLTIFFANKTHMNCCWEDNASLKVIFIFSGYSLFLNASFKI